MKSKSKIVTATAAAALGLLDTMSRDELRAVAKATGIATGKDRKNTVSNLHAAIASGKLHFKAGCTLSVNPAKKGEPTQRVTYFGKTIRTYVSGPQKGNVTWLTPTAPQDGSPSLDR